VNVVSPGRLVQSPLRMSRTLPGNWGWQVDHELRMINEIWEWPPGNGVDLNLPGAYDVLRPRGVPGDSLRNA